MKSIALRRAVSLVTVAASIVIALLFAGASAAASSAHGSRISAVLFLSYDSPSRPAFDVASVHEGAWDQLVAALRSREADVVPRAEVLPLLYKWRVRNALLLKGGFLSDVSSGLGASRIFVADLTLYPDRLVLAGRCTRTDTGEVLWADIEEQPLPSRLVSAPDSVAADWVSAIGSACTRLVNRQSDRTTVATGEDVYLMPVRGVGVDPSTTRLVSHCLLRSVLETAWRIQDPGVTFAALSDSGNDPAALQPPARFQLSDGRGPCELLVCYAVGFDLTSQPVTVFRGESESSSALELKVPSVTVTVHLLGGHSGTVISAASEHIGVPPTRGLFGLAPRLSLIKRMQPVLDRLVRSAAQKG